MPPGWNRSWNISARNALKRLFQYIFIDMKMIDTAKKGYTPAPVLDMLSTEPVIPSNKEKLAWMVNGKKIIVQKDFNDSFHNFIDS